MPSALYSAAQCRQLDRVAIDDYGLPGIVLMKRAGRAAYETLLCRWPEPGPITVFCGAGNNAGDGYIVAALAAQQNRPVRIIQVGDPARLRGDAALAHDFACQAGVAMQSFAELSMLEGVVVDALLGTGVQGAPRGAFASAIQTINASALPVLAIDLPSGLNADTGQAEGACVRAEATITFIGPKRGLFTGQAPALTGEIFFHDLGVPPAVYETVSNSAEYLFEQSIRHHFGPRAADAHKGKFGHVLVIGGDLGMGGAALMAAEAAGRVGAGLVSVATRPEHIPALLARRPELMVRGVESPGQLTSLLERASVLVIGPGLGKSDWSRRLLEPALASKLPKVLDADALNLISENPEGYQGSGGEWVLTPHPGEAARLLGESIAAIQHDRFAAVRRLQALFGGAVILKGAGSLIASDRRIALAPQGNPGMASGGMGDVLSGVIGGLLAQGLKLADAAEAAAVVHGQAADLAARDGQRGLLATDLLSHLRHLVNPS